MEKFYFNSKLIVELIEKLNTLYDDEKYDQMDDTFSHILELLSGQEYIVREKKRGN